MPTYIGNQPSIMSQLPFGERDGEVGYYRTEARIEKTVQSHAEVNKPIMENKS